MKTGEPLRYEDAAHEVIVAGWACKKCGKFRGKDEHLARWCCATDLQCKQCGGRNTNKLYHICQACVTAARAKREDDRWEKAEKVDWDGTYPVCTVDDDRVFFNEDDLTDWLAERLEDGAEGWELRLQLGEPSQPDHWDLQEAFDNYLPTPQYGDAEPPGGWEEVEKHVNNWLKTAGPWCYYPSGPCLTPGSVRAAFPELPWPPCPDELAASDMNSEGCPHA